MRLSNVCNNSNGCSGGAGAAAQCTHVSGTAYSKRMWRRDLIKLGAGVAALSACGSMPEAIKAADQCRDPLGYRPVGEAPIRRFRRARRTGCARSLGKAVIEGRSSGRGAPLPTIRATVHGHICPANERPIVCSFKLPQAQSVVVIGAGLAGLRASGAAGKEPETGLGARDRVGGRVTVDLDGCAYRRGHRGYTQ